MANIGSLHYYVQIRTYTNEQTALGNAKRVLKKEFYAFASVSEAMPGEKIWGGTAEGQKGIAVEMRKTHETIKSGDEIIYNCITYRIDSVKLINSTRIAINGKADDSG